MKKPVDTAKLVDAFRINMIKTIIDDPSETLLVRGLGMDDPAPAHNLFKAGKVAIKLATTPLRSMGGTILGAAGVTVPSEARALGIDSHFSGPATPKPNESWILYSEPWALAHEFGHAFLMFSGASWQHGGEIGPKPPISEPGGAAYTGGVNDYIRGFVEEQLTDVLTPESGLHFSPTAVRDWPERPPSKGFRGTWLQFLAKHPGAKVTAKTVVEKEKTKMVPQVCVPGPGEICP